MVTELTDDSTATHSDTYAAMARAIHFMVEHRHEQPDLATIAAQVNLSEYHFQRLFTRWVGLSPKRFLRCLTLEAAKARLANTQSLLHLSQEVGLSGPGRLHDLFVTLQAMTPGEAKGKGQGLQIYYGMHATPVGLALMGITDRGICHLQFADEVTQAVAGLGQAWPQATLIRDDDAVRLCWSQIPWGGDGRLSHPRGAGAALKGHRPPDDHSSLPRPLPLLVRGTNFQVQVWQALLQIPPGGLVTYGTVAALIGRPTACQAVGSAIGRNPIAYLIPCHRVIRESGALGGYRWGLDRKAALLGWEAARAPVVIATAIMLCAVASQSAFLG
ncbi:Bifunctional transcriptional activator/DNA repair enzyme Ada [Halomicronema hongdechloris C2206]|uniref:methylated-DNA--[protein]-cysteine S-methyltransferase n=1 Tax=Halomicronema hongdechloris C2206 TaxID=1641165 RepID=A0A1Z3HTY8_9CYAN|nr:methylated-DNA--[protein]-cysteine S-methyltransferase [Halomicronema hongdechloris]ASC73587.1 Bifunctional transcriptional activator/DNA repair enzyme Ada [Halomicronema hongdechloris C2206]